MPTPPQTCKAPEFVDVDAVEDLTARSPSMASAVTVKLVAVTIPNVEIPVTFSVPVVEIFAALRLPLAVTAPVCKLLLLNAPATVKLPLLGLNDTEEVVYSCSNPDTALLLSTNVKKCVAFKLVAILVTLVALELAPETLANNVPPTYKLPPILAPPVICTAPLAGPLASVVPVNVAFTVCKVFVS